VTRDYGPQGYAFMLMTSMQLIFAAVIMLVQPARHDDDGGQVGNGVAVAWSGDVSPEQSRPATAVARREMPIPSERPTAAARARAAKQVAPNSNQVPRAKVANLRAAAAVAAHATPATAIPAPEQKAKNIDTEKTATASSNDTDYLVAVVMARLEINSVSDLAGKSIAIDARQSASNGSVRTAIAAAGAAEVQLSEGETTAINRVTNGEVPAAVLALVSPEAAEAFPEIAGFRIFRVPLSPRAMKGRPNTL
jgi:hypothetical protein